MRECWTGQKASQWTPYCWWVDLDIHIWCPNIATNNICGPFSLWYWFWIVRQIFLFVRHGRICDAFFFDWNNDLICSCMMFDVVNSFRRFDGKWRSWSNTKLFLGDVVPTRPSITEVYCCASFGIAFEAQHLACLLELFGASLYLSGR